MNTKDETDSERMSKARMKIVETNYNLEQAFLRAKRAGFDVSHIVATIYCYQSVIARLAPDLVSANLQRVGQVHHHKLTSREISMLGRGAGLGLHFEEADFDF